MPAMPVWALALMIAMQEAPAVAQMMDLSQTPPLSAEQFAALQAVRDQAIADYAQAIGSTTV